MSESSMHPSLPFYIVYLDHHLQIYDLIHMTCSQRQSHNDKEQTNDFQEQGKNIALTH